MIKRIKKCLRNIVVVKILRVFALFWGCGCVKSTVKIAKIQYKKGMI